MSGRLRDIGLQFCFAIQINLCNLTAIQKDCSQIAEIAVRFCNSKQSVQSNCNAGGLQSDCGDCSLIAEIAV